MNSRFQILLREVLGVVRNSKEVFSCFILLLHLYDPIFQSLFRGYMKPTPHPLRLHLWLWLERNQEQSLMWMKLLFYRRITGSIRNHLTKFVNGSRVSRPWAATSCRSRRSSPTSWGTGSARPTIWRRCTKRKSSKKVATRWEALLCPGDKVYLKI